MWAASGSHAIKYNRGKEVCFKMAGFSLINIPKILRITSPFDTFLSFITIFGPQLLALDEDGGRLFAWDTDTGGIQFTTRMDLV